MERVAAALVEMEPLAPVVEAAALVVASWSSVLATLQSAQLELSVSQAAQVAQEAMPPQGTVEAAAAVAEVEEAH